jgi:DNA-directed RNA polymerase subunit omega
MGVPDNNNFPLERISMTIETRFDSNYRKVLVAARRARQIQSGAAALVPSRSTKACRIAQEEVDAGKISYIKKEQPVVKPLVADVGIPIL